ncbi:MAG: YidB family protein [Gallionella sp.]|nr:YidB family protein [Gallionella sp.]
MGLLDSLVGQVGAALANNQTQNGQGGLMEVITHLVNNPETGGLSGLVKTFQEQGLGDAMASWISTGQNQAVSANQIQQVLGSAQVQQLAQQFGLSPELLSSGLATMLPQVIDTITPNGQLPANNQLVEQGLSLLKGKLFG